MTDRIIESKLVEIYQMGFKAGKKEGIRTFASQTQRVGSKEMTEDNRLLTDEEMYPLVGGNMKLLKEFGNPKVSKEYHAVAEAQDVKTANYYQQDFDTKWKAHAEFDKAAGEKCQQRITSIFEEIEKHNLHQPFYSFPDWVESYKPLADQPWYQDLRKRMTGNENER